MAVNLYDSSYCRLCGEDNDGGNLLFLREENKTPLCDVINTYLPIKVTDDGQLPRTICPGCTIQTEATIEFFNLITDGQKILRDILKKEKELTKFNEPKQNEITDALGLQKSNAAYKENHPMVLKIAGKPKRKRGRPPKKTKTPEEVEKEEHEKQLEINAKTIVENVEPSGKRRRKTPTRFKEVVQGKELERIFIEEGVTDGESDTEDDGIQVPKEPEVIGHMENSGELVVVVKGKGRGRPKGSNRNNREECAICGMTFSCIGRYMSHIAQHGPVMYQCEQCSENFGTRLDFNNHQQETGHTGQNVIQCKKETQEVSTENNDPLKAKQELKQESEVTISTEEIFDTDPLKIDPLEIEVNDNNDTLENSEFVVENIQDGAKDADPDATVEETNDETAQTKDKKKLKCNHCDKLFNSKQSKSLHIKATHKGERPYACKECDSKFGYPRSLALHMLSHRRKNGAKGYACDLCGKVLNHPSSVIYHKEAEHAGQRYVCNKCGKSFKHKQLLQRHQLVHTQIRPYTCKHCPSSFKTKTNMMNHMLLHAGVKRFSCNICKQKFAHKTSLTLHMRWHNGVKPFQCKYCEKSFSQKGNLSEHERIHTGERPHRCHLCARTFTTSSQRRLHLQRHLQPRNATTGLQNRVICECEDKTSCPHKAHKCTVCDKIFASRPSLYKHCKHIHGLILMSKRVTAPAAAAVRPRAPPARASLAPAPPPDAGNEGTGDDIIYVAYDFENPGASFEILTTEQTPQTTATKSSNNIYTGSSLLVQEQTNIIDLPARMQVEPTRILNAELDNRIQMNASPIQIIGANRYQIQSAALPQMEYSSDGIQVVSNTATETIELEEPSLDGLHLLGERERIPVVTQDGQTIPVEINSFGEDEEDEEVTNDNDTIVQQLSLQKNESGSAGPVTHYFTIV